MNEKDPTYRSPAEDAAYFGSIWGLSKAEMARVEKAFEYHRDNNHSNTLIEELASRIHELEQKLRATSLEALAISDTNNEMAAKPKVFCSMLTTGVCDHPEQIASQARLSEAVKVLEGLLDVTESDNTPNDMIRFLRSRIQAFIATLGGEK